MNAQLAPLTTGPDLEGVRVALLTNFIPPYRVPLFRELQARLGEFRVLISTPMETDRSWQPEWADLSVTVQRTVTITRRDAHPHGFAQRTPVHVPYDTLWRLKTMSPDVVIAGELGFRTVQAVTYRRWLASKAKLIIWATLSEVTELGRGRMRRLLRTYVLPRADAVLVNGSSGLRYISSFAVPKRRIFTVPQTADIAAFKTVPLERAPECRRRLLYCGQLIERKGLEPFITTLCKWAERHLDRRLELWLVGDGPLRLALEGLPRPLNLVLRFVGNVPYRDLATWYAQAGILAFPTLADEWGLVVNEALAAGMPVLGSLHSQAVEELVRDGENGWTFRPDRGEHMESALDRALSVPDGELETMRVRARRSVDQITPAFVAGRILDAVRFVLAESRIAPPRP